MPPQPLLKTGPWRQVAGQVFQNYPLAPLTTWKIGGPARFLVIPRDLEDVLAVQEIAQAEGWPLFFLGRGSNVLIADAGLPGITLYLAKSFQKLELQGDTLKAGAGVILPRVARFTAAQGLKGFEFLIGIPGTVGAAVRLNAGAHGQSIALLLKRVRLVTPQGELRELTPEELAPSYRFTRLLNHPQWLVVEADFTIAEGGDPQEIFRCHERLLMARRAKQPADPRTCGSVFKNPASGPRAWQLIDAAGWRGRFYKGARVSRKHANFIINQGGATAAAMMELVEAITESVWKISGIRLEREFVRLPEDVWPR